MSFNTPPRQGARNRFVPPPLLRSAARISRSNEHGLNIGTYIPQPVSTSISTNVAPHVGSRNITDTEDILQMPITNGTEMVELHGNPSHLFTKEGINGWIKAKGTAVSNPITRQPITQGNIKRYSATVRSGGRRRGRRSTRRSIRRRSKRQTRGKSMMRGGGLREDAMLTFDNYAKEHNINKYDLFQDILNVNYYLKKSPGYNSKGLSNPMIIGNFVFRCIGHRDYYLEARPKTYMDTPEALQQMADVEDNVYIDKDNKDKYVNIMQISDR